MIFKQLFEPESCTYTYLLGCRESKQALLIDPVLETVARDLAAIKAQGLTLAMTLETHIHADHITGAGKLRQQTGCKIATPAKDSLACSNIHIAEGAPLVFGQIQLHPLFTPGHTDNHHAYLATTDSHSMVFTGDALLIDGCGRTDFQSGDAATLYQSIHEKLFALPDETLVYPAHDYEGRFVSTIAQEKARNPRLGGGKSKQEFIAIMDGLDLPPPKKMQQAVPANKQCGSP